MNKRTNVIFFSAYTLFLIMQIGHIIKDILYSEVQFPKWMRSNYIYLLIEFGLVCMISYCLYRVYLNFSYIYTSDGSIYKSLDQFNTTLDDLCFVEFRIHKLPIPFIKTMREIKELFSETL